MALPSPGSTSKWVKGPHGVIAMHVHDAIIISNMYSDDVANYAISMLLCEGGNLD